MNLKRVVARLHADHLASLKRKLVTLLVNTNVLDEQSGTDKILIRLSNLVSIDQAESKSTNNSGCRGRSHGFQHKSPNRRNWFNTTDRSSYNSSKHCKLNM